MKLKIISDGKINNTHVFDMDTGEKVEGVISIEWELAVDSSDDLAKCTIQLYDTPIEIVADGFKKYELKNENSSS